MAVLHATKTKVQTAGLGVHSGGITVITIPPSGNLVPVPPPEHSSPPDLQTKGAGQSAAVAHVRITGLQVPGVGWVSGHETPAGQAFEGGVLHAESTPQSLSATQDFGEGAQTPVAGVVVVVVTGTVVVTGVRPGLGEVGIVLPPLSLSHE